MAHQGEVFRKFASFGDAEKKFFETFNEFMASKSLKTLYSLAIIAQKKTRIFFLQLKSFERSGNWNEESI